MIDVVAIEKVSSIAFLQAVFDTHARGEVAFPVERLDDPAPDGVRIIRRVNCAEGGGWFSQHVEPAGGDEPAQVTLTSGTTSLPKPILLSRRAFADAVTRLIDVMGLTSDIREYVGVPVTYSFGFGRVRAVSAVGGACCLPENGFRIDELAAMLRAGEVNALSAVPTLLRLLINQSYLIADAGKHLRWLEIGSQPMSVAEKRAIRDLFPNARIIQHYGLTEASRSTFLDVSQASDAALASVGSPNGEVELRITDEGLIAIRGPHVATGIVTAEGVTPLTDTDGWLVTRDLGRLEDGHLFFEGRVDHLLNIGGIKVSAEAFEEDLAAMLPAPVPFAVAGGQDVLRGQKIVIAHPDTLDANTRLAVQLAAAELAARYRVAGAVALLPMPAIPLTETGKVRRGEITRLFDEEAERTAASEAAEEPSAPSPMQDPPEFAAGLFRILRRLTRASRIGGQRFSLVEIERRLADNATPGVVAGDDDAIVVCLENAASQDDARALLEGRMAIPADALVLLAPDVMPRLSSGKPDRAEILRAGKATKAQCSGGGAAASLTAVYARALYRHSVTPDDSFASLGGDSLGYIEVSIAIEKLLGHLPDHWEALSIAQIEALAAQRPAETGRRLASVETEMLIRPVAMTAIVSSHVLGEMPSLGGYAHYLGGGAVALLMAAGYNVCRFQKGTLLSDRRHLVVTNFLRRVGLPFYAVVLYKCLQWARGGPYVAWSTFALLDDYIRYPDAENFLIYWFIGALFQCTLIVTALFYVRRVRDFAQQSGYYFGLALLVVAYVVKVAVHITLLPKGAIMFPNNQLDNWAYAFAIGWMVGEARNTPQRLACILFGMIICGMDWGFLNLHTIMLTTAILTILYVPRIKMPSFVQAPIALWARATFYIYLTHGFAMAIMRSERLRGLLGGWDIAIAVATVLLSTAGGIAFFLLWRQGEYFAGKLSRLLGKGRTTGSAPEQGPI